MIRSEVLLSGSLALLWPKVLFQKNRTNHYNFYLASPLHSPQQLRVKGIIFYFNSICNI